MAGNIHFCLRSYSCFTCPRVHPVYIYRWFLCGLSCTPTGYQFMETIGSSWHTQRRDCALCRLSFTTRRTGLPDGQNNDRTAWRLWQAVQRSGKNRLGAQIKAWLCRESYIQSILFVLSYQPVSPYPDKERRRRPYLLRTEEKWYTLYKLPSGCGTLPWETPWNAAW